MMLKCSYFKIVVDFSKSSGGGVRLLSAKNFGSHWAWGQPLDSVTSIERHCCLHFPDCSSTYFTSLLIDHFKQFHYDLEELKKHQANYKFQVEYGSDQLQSCYGFSTAPLRL